MLSVIFLQPVAHSDYTARSIQIVEYNKAYCEAYYFVFSFVGSSWAWRRETEFSNWSICLFVELNQPRSSKFNLKRHKAYHNGKVELKNEKRKFAHRGKRGGKKSKSKVKCYNCENTSTWMHWNQEGTDLF